jgi:hypothetical protein
VPLPMRGAERSGARVGTMVGILWGKEHEQEDDFGHRWRRSSL